MANYEEIVTTSWGGRIAESFKGILVGIVLFIAAFPLIVWNESRSIDRIRTLDAGRDLVVAVSSDEIDDAHEGDLVHFSGEATTDEILADTRFGVEENALKLMRIVEMYQWQEDESSSTEKNMGGSETTKTTYSYEKVWSESLIDSSAFKQSEEHQNPSSMPYTSRTYVASTITVGAFELTEPFVEQIDSFEEYPLSQENFDAMDPQIKKSFILNGDTYFKGNPEDPQIGDIRISYGIITPTEVSVIGKQDDDTIQTYYTKNGSLELLQVGDVSAETMFMDAENENTLITWLIRLGAFLMMWVGLSMVFGPISVLGDVVPLIGTIFGVGIGVVTGLVSLVLSIVVMAVAWIAFRPIIGITLLVLAGVFFLGGFTMIKNKLQKPQANNPHPIAS